jgi:hypothetical protein
MPTDDYSAFLYELFSMSSKLVVYLSKYGIDFKGIYAVIHQT